MQLRAIQIAVTVILMIFAGNALAQSTSRASANATVVAPVTMTKNVDMNFGNAAVSASTGGMVILSPGSSRTTSGGGITLPATAGSVSAAGFTVSGAPGYTYNISLPGSALISGPGAATMTVTSFTSIPSATGTLNAGGTQALYVGATLYVSPAQAAGIYTNAAAVPVTVNYN